MPSMTTTRNGIRVEDITFRNARRQCEIENEIESDMTTVEGSVQIPVSLTPEQVKSFYEAKREATNNSHEKKVYMQTIKWIDELLVTKKKLIAVEEKLETYKRVEEDSKEQDIQ